MRKIALVLACLACTCRGRRLQGEGSQMQRKVADATPDSQPLAEGSSDAMRALSKLLVTSKTAASAKQAVSDAGFNPSIPAARSGKQLQPKRRAQAPRLQTVEEDTGGIFSLFEDKVPLSQQPIFEMKALRKNYGMDWADSDEKWESKWWELWWIISLFFSFPISYVTYQNFPAEFPNFFVAANIGTFPVMFIFILRLKGAWGLLLDRLQSKRVYYEAEGFGLLSPKKTREMSFRDRTLIKEEVAPIVKRLDDGVWGTIYGFFFTLIAAQALLIIQGQNGPYTLKSLTGDEAVQWTDKMRSDSKAAAEEQRRALTRKDRTGRVLPVYCDSRYYKILAGNDAQGGGGCL